MDIKVNKSGGQVNLLSALTMDANNQDLTIEEGTFDLNGFALTVSGSGGTFVVESGGNLQLQGGESCSTPTLQAGSSVTYDGTSDASIKDWTYTNADLVINGVDGDEVFTLSNTETMVNCTISSGVLSLNGNGLTASNALTCQADGILRLQGGESCTVPVLEDNSTVEYVGAGTYTELNAGDSYYNLTFNGLGS